jgi:hypothetical protein
MVGSAWLEHAPFAAWIIDAARPRTLVELGTHNGFSFFAFAEAARRPGLPTRLWAVDSWEGDEHAGFYGDEVYGAVQAVVDADYPDSAVLVRAYFADAVDRFADGSIDLLHLDGRHGYEDVKEDFETYRPKLSDRAVVLFHDTREYDHDFGVHRFWAEIESTAPSFEFHHAHGLGVLAWGPNAPARVLDFIRVAQAAPEQVREIYATLGAHVLKVWELELTVAGTKAELSRVFASTSWRITAPLRWLFRGRSRRGASA